MISVYDGKIPTDPSTSPLIHKIFVLCEHESKFYYTVCTSNYESAVMRTRKDPKRLVTLTAEEEKHLFRYPKGGTYTNISIETIQKAEIQNYQWEKLSKTRMSSDFTNRLYQAILDSDRETPETKKIIVPDSFFKIGQEE